jgi:Uma2 family endonuclease
MATINKHPQTITIIPGDRLTAQEYAQLPDEPGWRTELFRGQVVRMPAIRDPRHDWIVSNLHFAIESHNRQLKMGRCTLEQVGFNAALPGEEEDTTRAPDVTFSTFERIAEQQRAVAAGRYGLAPDLVAEVVSAGQSRPEMAERSERWLGAGSRLIWNIWPGSQTVDVWAPDNPMETIDAHGALDGLGVLPGFTLALVDLFA